MNQVAKLFQLNRQGLNLRRGAIMAVVLGLVIIVGVLPHERRYFLTVIFAALCLAVGDPGGTYGYRVPRMAVVAAVGALLTALAFGIGGGAWGFVVLAAFVATLLGGLAVKYGLHRFVAAYLLNVWFIVALGLPTLLAFGLPGLFRSGLIHTEPWKQALAFLTGSALWIAYTFIMWLAHGRTAQPQPVAEIPGDISPRPLTRPVVLFAVIRAAALSIAVAISFGLQLPHAYWMPVAAIIAMKPSLAAIHLHCRAARGRDDTGRRGGSPGPAGRRQPDRTRGDHRRPVRPGRVDPLRQLRLVQRGHGRGHPDRHGRAQPVQPC